MIGAGQGFVVAATVASLVAIRLGLAAAETAAGAAFWRRVASAVALAGLGTLLAPWAGEGAVALAAPALFALAGVGAVLAAERRPDLGRPPAADAERPLDAWGAVVFVTAVAVDLTGTGSTAPVATFLTALGALAAARFATLASSARGRRWTVAFSALGLALAIPTAALAAGERLPAWASGVAAGVALLVVGAGARIARRIDWQLRAAPTSPPLGPRLPPWTLVAAAVALPVLHLLVETLELLPFDGRPARDRLVVVGGVALGAFAMGQNRLREEGRRAAEEQRRESEDRNRRLVESLPAAIFLEQEGRLLFANPAGERLLSQAGAALPSLALALDGRATPIPVERRLPRPGGERELEVSSVEVAAGGRPAHLVVARDVSAFRRLRGEAERLERLAALGEFAAQVAHEIRNPLGSLVFNFRYLEGRGDLATGERRALDEAQVAVEEMKALVSGVLELARADSGERQDEDVVAVLESALRAVQGGLGAGIRVERAFRHTDARRAIDVHGLLSAFRHLLENAAQAMPDGGLLRLEASQEGLELEVAVADSGAGVAEADLPRLFEPFFTTRPGRLGLGLALAARVFEQHRCRYSIERLPERGTRVRVRFPPA